MSGMSKETTGALETLTGIPLFFISELKLDTLTVVTRRFWLPILSVILRRHSFNNLEGGGLLRHNQKQ